MKTIKVNTELVNKVTENKGISNCWDCQFYGECYCNYYNEWIEIDDRQHHKPEWCKVAKIIVEESQE